MSVDEGSLELFIRVMSYLRCACLHGKNVLGTEQMQKLSEVRLNMVRSFETYAGTQHREAAVAYTYSPFDSNWSIQCERIVPVFDESCNNDVSSFTPEASCVYNDIGWLNADGVLVLSDIIECRRALFFMYRSFNRIQIAKPEYRDSLPVISRVFKGRNPTEVTSEELDTLYDSLLNIKDKNDGLSWTQRSCENDYKTMQANLYGVQHIIENLIFSIANVDLRIVRSNLLKETSLSEGKLRSIFANITEPISSVVELLYQAWALRVVSKLYTN